MHKTAVHCFLVYKMQKKLTSDVSSVTDLSLFFWEMQI